MRIGKKREGQEKEITNEHREALGGDGYVYLLD